MKSLSDLVILAWNISAAEALSANFEFILQEHVFISLTEIDELADITSKKLNFNNSQMENVRAESSYLDKFFNKSKIDRTVLRRKLRNKLGEGKADLGRGSIHRDKLCYETFSKAQSFSGKVRCTNVLDLLRALFLSPGRNITEVLKEYNLAPGDLLVTVDELEQKAKISNPELFKPKPYVTPGNIDKILLIGEDMIGEASQGRIVPCIGREKTVAKVTSILKRQNRKKNVFLMGYQGIGKTALMETIAVNIDKRQVPESLADTTIIRISPEYFLKMKSTVKSRFSVLKDAILQARANENIILYFERLDRLLDYFKKIGKRFLDLLLESIASGHLQVVASAETENAEIWFKEIEDFSVFFEGVELVEPLPLEVLEILRQRRSEFELRYNLKITGSALKAILILDEKLNLPGVFPKKALNVLDNACVKAALPLESQSKEIIEKITAVSKKFKLETSPDVNEAWISYAVSEILAINVIRVAGFLDRGILLRISNMKNELQNVVLGQEKALSKITDCLQKRFANETLGKINPIVLLFVGPHGVGKTQTARNIARFIFDKSDQVVFFDMKQFSNTERIKRLFGLDGRIGVLEQVLSENPFQVLLFENIENASANFYVSFSNFINNCSLNLSRTVFVLTTGKFASLWSESKNMSESKIHSTIIDKLPYVFPKAFLNTIDSVIIFNRIVSKYALIVMSNWIEEKRTEIFDKYHVKLNVPHAALEGLVKEGMGIDYGMRNLRIVFEDLFSAVIQKHIDRKIIKKHKNWHYRFLEDKAELVPGD
ncbi:MAG TPA: AAA family ATPase [Elusimicrobiales bacterium]|nr:AAA family ATPase [Elusimicrobiales bacterium]